MIIFKVKEMLKRKNMSRYKLQKITNWNYRRINAYYFNKVVYITLEELDRLCEIFECEVDEIIERKEK